jgi:hypothetical protein
MTFKLDGFGHVVKCLISCFKFEVLEKCIHFKSIAYG